MIKNIFITLTAVLFFKTGMAQGFSGKVFIDKNANGTCEAGETGLSGVRVSDGLQVTVTDATGNYHLPGHVKNRFIFITTPAGYKFSKSFYARIDSSITAYNFGVIPVKQGAVAKFVRLTDTETALYNNWATEARDYARNEGADFMIHTGDICYEKGLQFHAQQINTSTMGLPVYYCIGNHDLVKGPYGEALYESLFGPVFYSFEAGPAHFIVTPMRYGDYQPSYTVEDVLQWLKNDLAHADPAKPVIAFNHDLLTYDTLFTIRSGKDSINLNDHRLKAWIYGHWHINFARTHGKNGVRSLCSAPAPDGGIDNSAANFDVIGIDKNGISYVQRRYTYVDNQLVQVSPAAGGVAFNNNQVLVSVNAYQTASPVKSVRFTLFDQQGKQVQQLQLQPRTDWNWAATIPVPAAGMQNVYTSTVEATLGTGKILFRRDTFRLAKTPLPAVTGQVWPEVLQDALRQGTVANATATAPSLQLAWSANIGGNIWKSSPVCAEGKVFVATIDDEENTHCGIMALDAATGKRLWQVPTHNSVKHSMSYHNGVLLATDAEGITYALEAATGKIKWQHAGPQHSLPAYNSGGVARDGIYYTGAGNYLEALTVASGQVKWTNRDWRGGEGTPAAMSLKDGLLVTSSNWNHLFAHDAATGKVLWKREDGGIRFRSGTAAFYGNRLYVHGINKLHIIDPANGQTVDSIPVEGELKTMTAPVVTAQHIIIATASHGMMAFDKQTKQLQWRFVPQEALFYTAPYTGPSSATIESTPLVVGNKIYVGASDGYVYVIDGATGKALSRFNVGAPVFAEMAICNGLLYVADFSGNVNAFKL
ncbi:outer membrane protein assembly factor BamB family protein [Chitinophaga nivalis]|uniref:PQQ-binding-like beta-propeller repeat protein n=1 Tax=Chitinophaga nivalis TaxID=2991709 RepID=A0ABT3IEN2_9BACT|nr:PQQ-binding-like beta-propeller repeat protein [Chitinophaga nivalis]MCW3467890.1 PQQ-binding-like beta-propeller repeat protein [Chitinophaga nivalis]MCW3482419.1 PQQ-binding-like beta-propeller repeat protein [Chitinophaga nivalis]